MNDVEEVRKGEPGTSGNLIEPRIKLIRSESIGSYSWDNKPAGTGSSSSEYGSNDWSDSTLMEVLNSGTYYNRASGNCPSGKNGATTSCDFSESGLTSEAKNMISKVKWKLGGSYGPSAVTAYTAERGTEVYTGRPTEWTGEVGLMYASDYGYATGGGSTTDRSTCLSVGLSSWNQSGLSECHINDWLYNSNYDQWTITPVKNDDVRVFQVDSNYSYLDSGLPPYPASVCPAVYLNTSVKIKSGTGSSTDPYILSN